jgi:hypothetical protein
MLFGGRGRKEYIGCFDCTKHDSTSICNSYGTFGNKYNNESIWNKYGRFGSKYNSESPWNKYSSDNEVPVLVDRQGKFYGYFTINNYRSDAVEFSKSLRKLFEENNEDLEIVRDKLCDAIR